MTQRSCITTPIYYVNDKPHIGHAYTSVACDVLSRFGRMWGKDIYFLTGTDEHGQKIQSAAAKKNIDPKAFVDEIHESFRDLSRLLHLQNDDFIRTTEPRHIHAAQTLWRSVEKNGYIYKDIYSGWYAERDEAYYQESELVNGKAPSGADVKWIEEESYFFKLSAFQDKLLAFYAEHPDFIAPAARFNEVKRFVEGGLKDLCVSRSTFSWGVPVPEKEGHIMYVWFDALTNYITALGYGTDHFNEERFKNTLHVVGKDILRFHAVYWPAFLMAAGIALPKRIYSHGWWTVEGEKMSKSLGNTVNPYELVDKYYVDGIRYFLLREISFGEDGDFSKRALVMRLNTDLANAYGNLVQRVCAFVHKQCEEKIPSPHAFDASDHALLDFSLKTLDTAKAFMDHQRMNKALESIWELVGKANQYMDFQAPWTLKKTDRARMETVLYVLLNVIRRIALLTTPFMPETSTAILKQLGENIETLENEGFVYYSHLLTPQQILEKPVGRFPKFDLEGDDASA
jgi:methionyl-tRNA synthetase